MRVVALVTDLMDRSRLAGAIPGLEAVSTPGACAGADVVVVDLVRFAGDVPAVRAAAGPAAAIVGYGPHADRERAELGRAGGADAIVARSRFFRDPARVVSDLARNAPPPDVNRE